MSLGDLILLPFIFGLVGFFEPCSLGVNIIFLNHLQGFSRAKRLAETLSFMLSRGLVLAMAGLSAAFIGKRFIDIQGSLFLLLGAFFIVLGVLSIINMRRPFFGFTLDFSGLVKDRSGLKLGAAFGTTLSLPLLFISYSESSAKMIRRLNEKAWKMPWITGAVLILVGALTILSSRWWLNAA